jgi:hypothetical protein
MPAYYVTIEYGKATSNSAIAMTAVVRGSATGALISRLALPNLNAEGDGSPAITAAGDDRHFAIALPTGPSDVTRFYLLTLKASGRVASLAAIPIRPVPAGEAVSGIALTPDGTKLAIAVHFPWRASYRGPVPSAEIKVVNLVAGSVRIWATHQAIPPSGGPSEPSWADGGRLLGFLWNEHDAGRRLSLHRGVLRQNRAPHPDPLRPAAQRYSGRLRSGSHRPIREVPPRDDPVFRPAHQRRVHPARPEAGHSSYHRLVGVQTGAHTADPVDKARAARPGLTSWSANITGPIQG